MGARLALERTTARCRSESAHLPALDPSINGGSAVMVVAGGHEHALSGSAPRLVQLVQLVQPERERERKRARWLRTSLTTAPRPVPRARAYTYQLSIHRGRAVMVVAMHVVLREFSRGRGKNL